MSEKIFRDTRTRIGILKSRGLTIKNKTFAKQIIRRANYYNLINRYKDPFLQQGTTYEKCILGSTINEIYALYEFLHIHFHYNQYHSISNSKHFLFYYLTHHQ